VSDSGTSRLTTPFWNFLGSVDLEPFPLGNLRVPPYPYGYRNGDIQHPADLALLLQPKGDNAIKLVAEY
jgi:hypothetical protein